MTRDDDRHYIRTALSIIRAPRPSWIKKGDLRGTEHIRREDVTWPETRGIEPEAKSVRQVLARIFRIRWDGAPVTVSLSSFCKVRDAVQMVAFDREYALEDRIKAIQYVVSERLPELKVSNRDIGSWLRSRKTAHGVTLRLFGLYHGVSPRRIKAVKRP